jgi:competence protein ComEA
MMTRVKDIGLGLALGLLAVVVLLIAAKRPPGHPVELLKPPTAVPLRVYVMGAVNRPGVYALARASILQDALDAAGGATRQADVSHLNLALLLRDGDQINVPALLPTATLLPPTQTPLPSMTVGPGTPLPTPPTATLAPTSAPTSAGSFGGLVNINTATLAELDTLPRIGPAIAQRIIDYRAANGPFATIEQIKNVKGIGDATFAQLKDLITVGP